MKMTKEVEPPNQNLKEKIAVLGCGVSEGNPARNSSWSGRLESPNIDAQTNPLLNFVLPITRRGLTSFVVYFEYRSSSQ